jgi:hypothetical protein
MPPYVGQLRSLEQGLEVPVGYVLGDQGSALARGENEVWVCPVYTDCLPLSHSGSSHSSFLVL